MQREDNHQKIFELEDLRSLARLVSLVARESNSFPPPILASKIKGNEQVYRYFSFFSLPLELPTKNASTALFGTTSKKPPKKYIRYSATPTEQIEFRGDKQHPIGEYLPLFPLSSRSQYSHSISNKTLPNSRCMESYNSKGKNKLIKMEMHTLRELVRYALETDVYPVIFSMPRENSQFYFLLGNAIPIGGETFGQLIYSQGEKIANPFLSINKDNELITSEGETSKAFSYARLIYTTKIPHFLVTRG